MKNEIHFLKLFEPLLCGTDCDNGNGRLICCKSSVSANKMDSKPEEYINFQKNSDQESIIPSGNYYFIQGTISTKKKFFSQSGKPAQEIFDAAELLWLEFVWREQKPVNDTIYLRILHEDNKKADEQVFQLFRQLFSEKNYE